MRSMTCWLLSLTLLLGGCGVSTQDRPEPIRLDDQRTSTAQPPPPDTGAEATVFLVRGTRLEPVQRAVAFPGVQAALEALAAGPTRAEVVDRRLRTALSPQQFRVSRTGPDAPIVSIDVSAELTSVAGENQLLAVAQIVWTATQFPGVQRVRLTSGGKPLEVPTDEGLSDWAVDREDYRSVAPRGDVPDPGGPPADPAPPAGGSDAPAGGTGG